MTLTARIDHLVVAAASLEQGAAWCQAALGVTPGPGGEHPLMGTHNRLLRIASADFPQAYLEIIAIQPGKAPQRPRRWFDLDDQALQAELVQKGPRLIHFVANVNDVAAASAALRALDLDCGQALAASRQTQRGLLEWKITVRDDGQRLFAGVLPTLIEWGNTHPAVSMPECGVTLQSLAASHPRAAALEAAFGALGLERIELKPGTPNLRATLITPRGRIQLESKGL